MFTPREVGNTSTCREVLRGFCHYPHRGVDAGRHSCKTTEYKSTDSPLPPLLNVMYSLRNTKEKGVVGNLCISLVTPETGLHGYA
jgi:hypothetical protein